jgi:RNA polymerase sigma factor (sigma-70 family)
MSSNAAAARPDRTSETRGRVIGLPSLTVAAEDPLEHPDALIRRIYAYVAYRLGDGPEAEDVVAATFERAVRYRHTYNRRRGEPIAWLIGIAKHCMNDAYAARVPTEARDTDLRSAVEFETSSIERLVLREAVSQLSDRDQELIALRYGADLSARSIAQLIGVRTNAVEVALHRALARLRTELEGRGEA